MNAPRGSSSILALLVTASCLAAGCDDEKIDNSPLYPPDSGGGAGDGGLTGEIEPVPGSAPAAGCHESSDNRQSGGCYGFYCGTNSNSIKAGLTSEAACGTDEEVLIACDGEATRTMATCARQNATMPDFIGAAKACARQNASLGAVSDACLDCFAQSAMCARDKCLIDCIAGDSDRCDQCRENQGCTPGFYDCGGLPDPQAP